MAPRKTSLAILGSGRMAAALAALAARVSGSVAVVAPPLADAAGTGAARFGGLRLPKTVRVFESLDRAALAAPLLVVAVPSFQVGGIMARVGPLLRGDQYVVHASRGLVGSGGGWERPSEVIARESCVRKLGALAGPFFADEVVKGEPSSLVAASGFREVVDATKAALAGGPVSLFTSDDLCGVELGGALGPIYAVAVGMAAGLGYGMGTRAALLTKALSEMAGFGATGGAQARTFSGLSGLGDLFTLVSVEGAAPFRFGVAVAGRAGRPDEWLRDVRIREARASADAVRRAAASMGVAMPILTAVAEVFDGARPTRERIEALAGAGAGRDADAVIDPKRLGVPLPALFPQGGRGKG